MTKLDRLSGTFFALVRGKEAARDRLDARSSAKIRKQHERLRALSYEQIKAEIDAMLARIPDAPPSREERADQLVNFVWGNNIEDDDRTRADVRKSLNLA